MNQATIRSINRSYALGTPLYARVYQTKAAWISPVVLVDRRMEGVWAADRRKSRATVRVELFASPAPGITRGVEAEVQRLARFWDTRIELQFTT